MKNKLSGFVIFMLLIILFSKCEKNEIETAALKQVSLYSCSAKSIDPYICFDSLLTDSRCPKGAVCIWQGMALIKVGFHENGNIHRFTMSLEGFPPLGYPSDTTVNGFRIVFKDLKPYPGASPDSEKTKEAFFNISH